MTMTKVRVLSFFLTVRNLSLPRRGDTKALSIGINQGVSQIPPRQKSSLRQSNREKKQGKSPAR